MYLYYYRWRTEGRSIKAECEPVGTASAFYRAVQVLHPEWGWWGNHQGWALEPSLHLTAGEMWHTKGSFELWIRSWKQRQQIQLNGRALASHKQGPGLGPQHYKHRTRIWKRSSTFLKCHFSNHLDVCFVTGSPVSQAGLKLTMHPKMILNSCL